MECKWIDASLVDSIEPALFPGNVAIASAGGGLAVANNMSEEKTELALEFIKYMTSKEVQEKILLKYRQIHVIQQLILMHLQKQVVILQHRNLQKHVLRLIQQIQL